MNAVRGIAVWLGAPLLASLICTAAWYSSTKFLHTTAWYAPVDGRAFDAKLDLTAFVGVGVVSLFFTIGGSTLLSLFFKAMSARPTGSRYIVLIGFGGAAGFAMMAMLPAGAPLAGLLYGTATACFWVGLHRLLYVAS